MAMNVQELIAVLTEVEDKTCEVLTEGCDCTGDVYSLELNGKSVLLARTPVRSSSTVTEKEDPFTEEERRLLPS